MDIVFERRAEVAFGALGNEARARVERTLERVRTSDYQSLRDGRLLYRFRPTSNTSLWVLRPSAQLRLIVSFRDSSCVIEDIVPHDRLDRAVALGAR